MLGNTYTSRYGNVKGIFSVLLTYNPYLHTFVSDDRSTKCISKEGRNHHERKETTISRQNTGVGL